MHSLSLATLFWDPDPVFIKLPFVGLPIVWYGVLFALGFLLAYTLMKRLVIARFKEEGVDSYQKEAGVYADRLLWTTILGTVIGARLGHILFYDLSYYLAHPGEIFKTWHGGLASHGGAVGILIALFIFHIRYGRSSPISPFRLLDILVVPTPIACAFIRLGNFVNQEIPGTLSNLPWAVTFGHPIDGSAPIPRHPVQLYEALAYLITFAFLFGLYRVPSVRNRPGLASGLFFILMFTARFVLEMFKEPYTFGTLNMGQWLSLPFLAGGIALTVFAIRRRQVAA